MKVLEKFFGNEILINSDCPYVNIAPLCPTLAPGIPGFNCLAEKYN
jgi:hypothetical protein